MDGITTDDRCRLCGGSTRPAFSKRLMYKHDVQYSECGACGSLQTQTPYWLDEAYREGLRYTDTFGGERALRNQVLTYCVFRLLGLRAGDRVVDWGGGDGLTTRLLRDVGLEAYNCDRYARNNYALGFEGALEPGLGMITAFEVWEHFADPARELGELFAHGPRALFISTGIYFRQGEQWPYLAPYSGRHVFFYSPQGVAWIARRFGYDYAMSGEYVAFSRNPLSWFQRKVIRALLSKRFLRFFRAWLALKQPAGLATKDWERMRREVKDDV